MCGFIMGCRFAELTPGQFGLTKQLVLRITLPHISLYLISIAYVLIGSVLLSSIRQDNNSAFEELSLAKSKYARSLLNRTGDPEEAFRIFVRKTSRIHARNPKSYLFSPDSKYSGSVFSLRSVFFTATALTSIGYGVDTPSSIAGRLFCIVYLFFGIPLYLITLTDIAKFCTEILNKLYTEFLKWKFRMKRKWKRFRNGNRRESNDIHNIIIAGGDDEVAEFLWAHLETTRFVDVPFLLIYFILLLYISASSYFVSSLEGWQLSDGFYYIMMSVLTIGFGDLIPRQENYSMLMLAIIFIGLILATTCIDVVGACYIDRLHFFGRAMDDDPLSWLKDVQQKRIEAMKREAMRRLFDTVTALHHIRLNTMQRLIEQAKIGETVAQEELKLSNCPAPPSRLVAFNATSDSVCLRWKRPLHLEEGRRFWYTLTYKPRNPHELGRNMVTVVDFINGESYEVKGLRSFTLYQFGLVTTTRFGSSQPIRCQEYTEPCTVPQSVRIIAISTETATIAWRSPKKNNGQERYLVQFSQEPAPQFKYWSRFRCGPSVCFTVTDLQPDTRYIACVTAEHNVGLAALSKSIRFRTRRHWNEDGLLHPNSTHHRMSLVSNTTRLTGESLDF